MGLKGFVIDIESILQIARNLLKCQSHVLTYKFSQDHLELFFAAVRRAGCIQTICYKWTNID